MKRNIVLFLVTLLSVLTSGSSFAQTGSNTKKINPFFFGGTGNLTGGGGIFAGLQNNRGAFALSYYGSNLASLDCIVYTNEVAIAFGYGGEIGNGRQKDFIYLLGNHKLAQNKRWSFVGKIGLNYDLYPDGGFYQGVSPICGFAFIWN